MDRRILQTRGGTGLSFSRVPLKFEAEGGYGRKPLMVSRKTAGTDLKSSFSGASAERKSEPS